MVPGRSAAGRRSGRRRGSGPISGVALLTALLLVGVAPAAAAASSPGHAAGPTATPSCSTPPMTVGWYGLDTSETPAVPAIGRTFWDADSVAIGYETTGAVDGFFVASDPSGEVFGVEPATTRSPGHVDGLRIDLGTNLTGARTVRVDWYCDVDGDGELDTDSDSPAGAVAGPTSIDFDATFDTPTTPVETADWIRTTAGPTGSEPPPTPRTARTRSPGQPGFTPLLALLAVVAVALLTGRR